MAEIMVVFYFDKTILACDSDEWVVDGLGFTDLFNKLLPTMPLNRLMDRMMMELHFNGKTIEDIMQVLQRIPIHPRIIPAIQAPCALGHGLIIKRIQDSISSEENKRFIYRGDGSGDYCLSLRLKDRDFVMPRKDFPVWDLICKDPWLIKAEIHEWSDGKELEWISLQLINKISMEGSSQFISTECKPQTLSVSPLEDFPPSSPRSGILT